LRSFVIRQLWKKFFRHGYRRYEFPPRRGPRPGIFVAENSGVNIEGANSTTSNNSGFGLRCLRGSYASGTVTTGGSGTAADSLNGSSGVKSFGATLTVMVAQGAGNSSFGPVADSDGSTFTVSPNGTFVLNSEGCIDNTD